MVNEDDMLSYYNENSDNFKLQDDIVKLIFIKVPVSAPNIEQIKELCKSAEDDDIKEIEDYCYQYASKYDYCTNQWLPFGKVKQELPIEIENPSEFLKRNKFIEMNDSSDYYYVNILDYRLKEAVAPYHYVKGKIKSIIMNKRKLRFVENLENRIYKNALNRNNVEIY